MPAGPPSHRSEKEPDMPQDNILKFSLADFFFNDNPDVLGPPSDFDEWMNHPDVRRGFSFFEQELLEAPRVSTRIRSNLDGRERRIINLTSYNYLGLSHPSRGDSSRQGGVGQIRTRIVGGPAPVGDLGHPRGVRPETGEVQTKRRLHPLLQAGWAPTSAPYRASSAKATVSSWMRSATRA